MNDSQVMRPVLQAGREDDSSVGLLEVRVASPSCNTDPTCIWRCLQDAVEEDVEKTPIFGVKDDGRYRVA